MMFWNDYFIKARIIYSLINISYVFVFNIKSAYISMLKEEDLFFAIISIYFTKQMQLL